MKRLLLALSAAVGFIWWLVPFAIRRHVIFGLVVLEIRIGPPAASLARLFQIEDDLERAINERATAYGSGVHPKHRLTNYHDFFVEHTPPDSRILDVGCGNGAVAAEVAERVPNCHVIGVDIDHRNISQAQKLRTRPNLEFRQGDIHQPLQIDAIDIIILSNILEHVDDRIPFLKAMISRYKPKLLLIRVPLFERDWKMPLRRELGTNFFSDETHFTEHTLIEFHREVEAAGLAVRFCQTNWGEIWAVCEPMTI